MLTSKTKTISLSTVRIEFQWPTTVGLCLDLRIFLNPCRIMSCWILLDLRFEVESLRNASPATVSRAGIIYVSTSDLGALTSWMESLTFANTSLMSFLGIPDTFPFSVGWAPLVESWLIQRMDLGRMVKLGVKYMQQGTNVVFRILELKRHARWFCTLLYITDSFLVR